MRIPYTALHTFHLIIRFGNLQRTADFLHLTESAVSHQIKRLEEQLGYKLFYKTGRQLKPTTEANRLATQLAQPFDHIDQVINTTKPIQPKIITIYCLPSLLESWLLPKLLSFKQNNPSNQLAIRYYLSAPDYLDEHSLRIGNHEQNSTKNHPQHFILSGETIAVCSPIYLSQNKKLTHPETLLTADLLHDHSEKAWQDWFAQQDIGYDQSTQFLYEDFHILKMATIAAQGVALCPEALIQKELAEGKLIRLFDIKGNIGRYYAIEHNPYLNQEVKRLLDYLIL